MALFPVSVRYARMIVEANKRNVLDEVITIAASSEVGGIKFASASYSIHSKEYRSDLLSELDWFNYIKDYIGPDRFELVIERNYYRALELRAKLYDIALKKYGDFSSSGNRNEILKSCATGLVEFLYVHELNGWFTCTTDRYKRKLNLGSSIVPNKKYVLGVPRNISHKSTK